MKKYILGNWKMNGSRLWAATLCERIAAHAVPQTAEVAVFPPFTAIATAALALSANPLIRLGAQDCSAETDGAFTGDISASMLKDAGCSYVLVGHSERRLGHGETDMRVKHKAQAAVKAGLVPVICVGETLEQRASGHYLAAVRSQVENSLPDSRDATFLIAYEPLWAIGSGKTPTLPEIAQAHKTIASALSYATSGARTPIVYGGSVKAANAGEILSGSDVDGVLVGGASLKADEFCAIITAARG